MSQHTTKLLHKTVAKDLLYTEDGVLNIGHMCLRADRYGQDLRTTKLRHAIHGCSTVIDVLRLDDSMLCSMGPAIRLGLINALDVMLQTISEVTRSTEDQPHKAKRGKA